MNCQPGPTCPRCQRPGPRPGVRRQCRPGLGDLVAAGLEAVGVTTARADRLARRLGLAGCGCAGRRDWLNRASGKPGNLGDPGALTPAPESGGYPHP